MQNVPCTRSTISILSARLDTKGKDVVGMLEQGIKEETVTPELAAVLHSSIRG